MIKIDSIIIEEFRGVRKLKLDFNGKNYAICGPNGTGKSGVVDAIEFILTGNISRLSGEGSGDISLKAHAPHVDKRNDPSKARVIATITIPSLKKTVTLERSVKTPSALKITPNEPEVAKVIEQVGAHPEVMLSRRELIKYVLATPGKRSEEVQALLHLDRIEEVRKNLQTIANATRKSVATLEQSVKNAADNLCRGLEIDQLWKENILAAVNPKREALHLPAITELTASTSLKDGMAALAPAKAQPIPKKQADADIQAANDALDDLKSKDTQDVVAAVIGELKALLSDPLAAAAANRESFYRLGIPLVEAESCPFCDKDWDMDELCAKVQKKLDHLKDLAQKREAIERKTSPLTAKLRRLQGLLEPLLRHAGLTKPTIEFQSVRTFLASCQASTQNLGNLHSLSDAVTELEKFCRIPKGVSSEIGELAKHVASLPDASKQDAAREFLTVAQERLEVYREAKRKEQAACAKSAQAKLVFATYVKVSDEILTALYSQVEKHFGGLYSAINRNDEKEFSAKLKPSMGKLGFNVDFYGRGFFPPGAYHSEGHQDGMGLCLYLALMRHVQGNEFTFAVLDDVLMSVDSGHRREVCALLKKEFPTTQFILTTHDPIWLRHMKTEGLVTGRSAVQFRSWDVDLGPTQWDDRDVWTEIADDLERNDVRSAASLLRHYLEHISGELCHRLRAPVEYRADAQYQLGELLPSAVNRLKKLYTKARDAAKSWGQKDKVASIIAQEAVFAECANRSKVEQWQVNVAVHFNSWDNLTKDDFAPVVQAYHDLLNAFNCADCGEIVRVAPERETADTIRCDCGKTSINLRKKAG